MAGAGAAEGAQRRWTARLRTGPKGRPPGWPRWLRVPESRAGRRRLVQTIAGLCTLALLPPTWLYLTAADRLRSPGDVPRTEVALVFGAGLWGDEPSPYLAHRLDMAARLYRAGRIEVVLATGDHHRVDYDEPTAMRTYLVERGVPDSRIVSDFAGFDTWDSCVRAKKIFGVHRAVLISQEFHIRRAVALCQAAGITPYGVGVPDVHDVTWYYGATRELLAAGKAAVEAVFRPDPTFLGPKEHGVARALRSPG